MGRIKKMVYNVWDVRDYITGGEFRADPFNKNGINNSKKARDEFNEIYPFIKLTKSDKWEGEYLGKFDESKFTKKHQLKYYKALASAWERDFFELSDRVSEIKMLAEDL